MITIGAFDAKTHFSNLLVKAEHGEEIIITRHGHPVAKIVPIKTLSNQQKMKLLNDELLSMRKGQDKGSEPGSSLKELIEAGRRY